MSILTKIVHDREVWASAHRASETRHGFLRIAELVLCGVLVYFGYYHHETLADLLKLWLGW